MGSRKVSSTASAVTDGRALRSFFIWVAAVQIQPVSGAEVATLLAHTAAFSPLFGVREIAGPDQFRLDTFLRAALNAVGEHRRVFTDDSSPYFGARLRPGDLLPGADAYIAGTHYADWLTGQLAIAEVSCRWPDH